MSKSNLTAWERWELASLDDGTPQKRPPLRARSEVREVAEEIPPEPEVHVPTAEEVEQIHRQAHESGHQEGHAEGLAAGRKAGYDAGYQEGRQLGEDAARQLLAVADKLDASLAAMDESVAAELTALALEIAREVLRQTLMLHPETVVGVVRDALTQLPHQHANIYLHPDDASLVRSYAGDQLSHGGHRIHEDARLQRNDVTIEAGGAHVDATMTTRWRRVVETLGQTTAWDGKPLLPPVPATNTATNTATEPATNAEMPSESPSPATPSLADDSAEADDSAASDGFPSGNPIADLTDDTPLPGMETTKDEGQ